MISTGEGLEGYNSIELDGFDFSQDLKGISIVVYDNDTDQVVDSVTIETDAGNGSLQRTEY